MSIFLKACNRLMTNVVSNTFMFHMESTCWPVSYFLVYRKNLVLLSFFVGSSFLVFLILYTDPRIYKSDKEKVNRILQYEKEVKTKNYTNNNAFLTDDMIRNMKKTIEELQPCTPNPLLVSNRTHIWVEKQNLPHYNLSSSSDIFCCYRSFYRPKSVDDITSPKIDNRVKYNKCRSFTDSIQIGVEDEFVRVKCSHAKKIFDSFFLFAREKKKIIKHKKELPYNVLILGLDSVSRLNLHRTMPQTVKLLNTLNAVEFLSYNKVGDNTFPNLMPLLAGLNVSELQESCLPQWNGSTFDNCPFIWIKYRQAGFVTAMGEDMVGMGTFNFNHKRGFADAPTDYYLRTFMYQADTKAGSNIENHTPMCMNEKWFFKILLDYVEDLVAVTKNRLFGFFWEASMTHNYLNYARAMDASYRGFFSKMYDLGYLNNSVIFVISDHGMRWGKFRSTRQGFLEDRLPLLFALIPLSFRTKYSEAYNNMKLNVHRLTTPYDVHATLLDLTNSDKIENSRMISRAQESYDSERGISLFLPIPRNRTCKSAGIKDHWCVDYRSVDVDKKSSEVREAVTFALTHLNGLLNSNPKCAELTLAKVLTATRRLPDIPEARRSIELTVAFRTRPSEGEFEATLKAPGPGKPWTLAGSVSRLNFYGNQSYCASADELKLYCYCVDSTPVKR